MTNRVFDFVKRLAENTKKFFSRTEYKQPHAGFSKSVSPFRRTFIRGSLQQKRIEWCRAFNRRNGGIVSAKSPISIYFKAGNK